MTNEDLALAQRAVACRQSPGGPMTLGVGSEWVLLIVWGSVLITWALLTKGR